MPWIIHRSDALFLRIVSLDNKELLPEIQFAFDYFSAVQIVALEKMA